jgi:hypothetical protein
MRARIHREAPGGGGEIDVALRWEKSVGLSIAF